ncbi:hypothetical protein GC170_12495 [bacterium]|nr:hypothetical protein [bacterium]
MNEQVRMTDGFWKSLLFAVLVQVCWWLSYIFEPSSPFAILCAAIITAELYLNPELFRDRPRAYRAHCAIIVISWICAAGLVVLEWM